MSAIATGGVETTLGSDVVHSFTSNGTLTVLSPVSVEFLLGAGGGGGGGGGGGAGEIVSVSSLLLTPGTYSVVIGAGGAGDIGTPSTGHAGNGQNSTFDSYTAHGGGGGGLFDGLGVVDIVKGNSGGSGGGGGGSGTASDAGGASTATGTGQGNAGGNNGASRSAPYASGGGGGGGGAGQNAVSASHAGDGGIGYSSTITGVSAYYGGGGGGGVYGGGTTGVGGNGGGGDGTSGGDGVDGTVNTSGGGGGTDSSHTGGDGGSGFLLVRYTIPVITPDPTPSAVYPEDTRVSHTPNSRYAWMVFTSGKLIADLTGLCTNRRFIITRNDSDQISFSISIDKLLALAKKLNINPQDVLQSWISEIRVSRRGVPIVAGELQPWNTNIGGDRMITVTCRGWFELLKWRRTSDIYSSSTTALTVVQDQITKTLARAYGSSGNYNGITIGSVPSVDTTNVYDSLSYDQKTLYDLIVEMSQEDGGFDFEMTYDKTLNLYHPAIGNVRDDIVFSYPHGNIKDIQYDIDPTKSFNYLYARGKGSGDSQIKNELEDVSSEQVHGLREDTRDYTNTGDIDQLTNLGQSELTLYRQPIVRYTIVFDGSGRTSAPQVGSFHIGDLIRISVADFQIYQESNQYFKIDRIQVDIDDNDMETVTLSVTTP